MRITAKLNRIVFMVIVLVLLKIWINGIICADQSI